MTENAPKKQPFVPPVFLVNSAMRLRRFFLRLADSVVPAYLPLMDRFMGAPQTMLVYSAARLRIADHLKDGPLTSAELAQKTGAEAEALDRAMRALDSIGVFRLRGDGRFENNHVSKALITGSPSNIRGFTEFFGMQPLVRAWTELPERLMAGQGSFERANGKHVWDWMAEDDLMRTNFVEGMSSMTQEVAPAIAASYPFGEVRKVCDVGGGVGIVLAAALNRHPHLQGMLFDSAAMLGEASAHLEKHGIAGRVELCPGSFFETIPRGADAYLLKTVLHNWPDEDALKILRNVRAAMDPGHRLLVADFLVEHDPINTLVPFMDIAGMMIFGGRERSPAVLSEMFTATGFRLGRVIELPGRQAVFEGIALS